MSTDRSRQLYRRLAPSFEAPDMATPGALGQLEGFLANLNLGKYFEVMRDNEVRRHHPRQRRPVPASPWALPGADLHRDGRRWPRGRRSTRGLKTDTLEHFAWSQVTGCVSPEY